MLKTPRRCSSLRVPGAEIMDSWGKEKTVSIAIAISFAMVVAAPFFGRWRANVWLKANLPAEETAPSVVETA
jgi:hypothetical protein